MTEVVGERSCVTLHFALKLPGGEIIDSNFSAKPATLTIGDGNLLPGFEQHLLGMKVGQRRCVTVPVESAFGHSSPENIRSFKRQTFASTDVQDLRPGLVIAFSDAANGEVPGVVESVDTENVQVNFNHPLAGRDIVFDVEIVAVVQSGVASE